MSFIEVFGQEEDQNNFGQVRGLKSEEPQRKSRPGSGEGRTEKRQRSQKSDRKQIEKKNQTGIFQSIDVQRRSQEKNYCGQSKRDTLLPKG